MTNKATSKQLMLLINEIINHQTYPTGLNLSPQERTDLVNQLKSIRQDPANLSEVEIIISLFYQDKITRGLKTIDGNFSWIFEIIEHELVSASRLHHLLLTLANEENFSKETISKINHYFTESDDYGDNENFMTMSSLDVLDALARAKTFQIKPGGNIDSSITDAKCKQAGHNNDVNASAKIIKLADYRAKESISS